MPHAAGDHVAIVRGANRGKNGTFVRNVGVASCHVVLEGKVNEQKFWLTSVAAAMVVPVPPLPAVAATARVRTPRARVERPEERPGENMMNVQIQGILNELEVAENTLHSLENTIASLRIKLQAISLLSSHNN
jgi:hypothetical protein